MFVLLYTSKTTPTRFGQFGDQSRDLTKLQPNAKCKSYIIEILSCQEEKENCKERNYSEDLNL